MSYAIVLSDCKGWNDGRAEEAVKHVHGWPLKKVTIIPVIISYYY